MATDTTVTPTDHDRIEAYRKAREAKKLLNEAAEDLRADDIHDLAALAYRDAYPAEMDDGIRALTNAYSYLANGQLEHLVPEDRKQEGDA